jgi:putative transposase
VRTARKNIQQIRITPHGSYLTQEVIYNIPDISKKFNNGRYAAIDIGLTNLAALASNVFVPVLYNGKPLKAINQFFNKQKAKQISIQENRKQGKRSTKLCNLSRIRKNKIEHFLHKTAKNLINQLVSNDISTLIIGENKGWKQEVNMKSKGNQNFVSVPFDKFKNYLKYKAEMKGINVICHEESYTSKASFLSNDKIPVYKSGDNTKYKFSGYRAKRGLYKDKFHGIINADVNGALNILRKAIVNLNKSIDLSINTIEACSRPVRLTCSFN